MFKRLNARTFERPITGKKPIKTEFFRVRDDESKRAS